MKIDEKKKWNTGWTAALVGWLVSSLIFPFLPEIKNTLFDGDPFDLFIHPPMEYVATIGMFAALFLLVWIPTGFRAASLKRKRGTIRAVLSAIIVFSSCWWFLDWYSDFCGTPESRPYRVSTPGITRPTLLVYSPRATWA